MYNTLPIWLASSRDSLQQTLLLGQCKASKVEEYIMQTVKDLSKLKGDFVPSMKVHQTSSQLNQP